MFIIDCPGCGVKTNFSFTESTYEGPFRCWKCRGTFLVIIGNEALECYKAISEEEFGKYTK